MFLLKKLCILHGFTGFWYGAETKGPRAADRRAGARTLQHAPLVLRRGAEQRGRVATIKALNLTSHLTNLLSNHLTKQINQIIVN